MGATTSQALLKLADHAVGRPLLVRLLEVVQKRPASSYTADRFVSPFLLSIEMDGYQARPGRIHSNGSSHGETTEDDMNDSVDGDHGDDDDKREDTQGKEGAAAVASAAAAPNAARASPATRSRLRRSVSFADSASPAPAPAAAVAADTAVLPQVEEKGRGQGGEEEEEEDEEQARVEAVIAAASVGGNGAAWAGEMHTDGSIHAGGVEAGMEMQQLFEGGHQVGQHQHQQRKATEAVSPKITP